MPGEFSASPTSQLSTTNNPSTFYTVRELGQLAEYLAREMDYAPHIASGRDDLWYLEQIGADMATVERAGILRRLTIHRCELGMPAHVQLTRHAASADWTEQHRLSATLLLVVLTIAAVWFFIRPASTDAMPLGNSAVPGSLTPQQFEQYEVQQ